jgi:hypothetical protein
MKQLIRKILKEETLKQTLLDKIKDDGFENTAMLVGGPKNLINIAYGEDLKTFYSENNNYVPYRISNDGMVMYIDELLVQYLELKDSGKKEKLLGDFGYGPKGGVRYKFTAKVYGPFNSNNGQNLYKVAGTSGDSGFGYSHISQRNTLGKRARTQIFQQIIDKYDLNSYL